MGKFTSDKAEWQFDTVAQEYCQACHKTMEALTETDVNIIWDRAANHISMFVTWLIDCGLLSKEHEENQKEIQAVRERKMTGFEYLLNICDLKLLRTDIARKAFKFMDHYYEAEGDHSYLQEYCDCMENNGKEVLATCFSWEDYEAIRTKVLDPAYQAYLESKKKF